jgi:hypothetical protein
MVNYHDRSSAEDGHFQKKKKIKKNTEQLIPPFRLTRNPKKRITLVETGCKITITVVTICCG